MAIHLKYAIAPLGHEILGLDLSQPLSVTQVDEIRSTFLEYGVIVFRDQQLTPRRQVELTREFGTPAIFRTDSYKHPQHPEIFVVSNIIENDKPIGMADAGSLWHSDGCYTEVPPWGSILYGIEVPKDEDGNSLGDTCFSSTAAAFNALPPTQQERLSRLKVVNSFAKRLKLAESTSAGGDGDKTASGVRDHLREERAKALAAWPDVTQPLIVAHPHTGKPGLYVSHANSVRIETADGEDQGSLLGELLDHVIRPEFVYRHRWQEGDLVFWDNFQSIHLAIGDYQLPQRRLMHRTTIDGVQPQPYLNK